MSLLKTTSYNCDVLVIGGGGAALMAALEAIGQGAKVLLLSKGRIGRSGNTMVAGAGFSAYVPDAANSDAEDVFIQDTLAGGKNLNDPALVELLVRASFSGIKDLEKYGVPFLRSGMEYVRRHAPGHSRPRSLPTVYEVKDYHVRGTSITLPLRRAAEEQGVSFLENSSVIELLRWENQVCGAVAINCTTQEINLIYAKAVILATGGSGRIYASTNNTADVCGDGYALALDAGCSLVDMEFVQFYPTMMLKPLRFPVSTPLFGDGAVLRNAAGERFLKSYDPAGEMATRDSMARAVFCEVAAGRGIDGGVYVDCSAIPAEVLEKKFRVFRDFLYNHALDPKRDWFVVSPTVHFFMGGIKINQSCASQVAGLYAAGEVCGGVHGANRLSGNALTETAVFGKIAGRYAAEFSAKAKQRYPNWKLRQFGGGNADLEEIRRTLRQIMWEQVSVIRSAESLQWAWNQLERCQVQLQHAAVNDLRSVAKYVETENMIKVGKVVT